MLFILCYPFFLMKVNFSTNILLKKVSITPIVVKIFETLKKELFTSYYNLQLQFYLDY